MTDSDTPSSATLPSIAYPKKTVEVDTAQHVMSWGGDLTPWAYRQLSKLSYPPDAIVWRKGLPRELLWTPWGELRLGDDLYEWHWGLEKYALAHLLRTLPPRMEPYVITRTRWFIAWLERDIKSWKADTDTTFKQEKLDRLKQQLADTGLADQDYQVLEDEDPIPEDPRSED